MSEYQNYLNSLPLDYDEENETERLRQISEINEGLVKLDQQQEYNEAVEGGQAFGESQNMQRPEPTTPSEPPSSGQETPEAAQAGDTAPTQEDTLEARRDALEEGRLLRKIPILKQLDRFGTAAGTALGDTLFDFAGKIGWQEGEDWWEKHNPSYHNNMDQAGREILSLIVPTLMLGGAGIKAGSAAATKLGAPALQGKTAKILGGLAAEAGADVLVTGVSDTSERDENLATIVHDHLGITLPWAVLPGDSPDLTRKKNITEAGLFTAGTSAVQLLGYLADVLKPIKKSKFVPLDSAAISKVDDLDDPISEAITEATPGVIEGSNGVRIETPPPRIDETTPKLQRIDDELRVIDDTLARHADEIENAQKSGIPLDAINDGLGPNLDDIGAQRLTEQKSRLLARRDKIVGRATETAGQRIDEARALRDEAQALEGQKRLIDEMVKGKEPEMDTFINNVGDSNTRAVMRNDASPKMAQYDVARIQKNDGTTYGRPHPVVTNHFMERTLSSTNLEDRADDLKEIFDEIAPQFDVWNGNVKYSAEDLDNATKKLTDQIFFDGDGGFDKFIENLNSMKKDIFNSQKILDTFSFQVASNSIRDAFEKILDPKRLKASALMTNQAAGELSDIAVAAEIIDGAGGSPARQMEMALTRMKLVAREVRAAQYARGKALQMTNLYRQAGNGDPRVLAKGMDEVLKEIGEGYTNAMKKSDEFFATLHDMIKADDQYLKPLIETWKATDGNVADIASMTKYLEQRVGVLGKAFVDGNHQIPSVVVQGLRSTRYNNVLNGQAPIRAAVGNATMMVTKPATTLMGNALGVGDMRRSIMLMVHYRNLSNVASLICVRRGGRLQLTQSCWR